MNHFSSNPFGDFIDAISRVLGAAPRTIEPDKIVRFDDPNGKAGNRACWAIFFPGTHPGGAYGNWRTGQQATWHAKATKHMTQCQRQEIKEQLNLARQQRYTERIAAHEQAADRARRIWKKSHPAPANHPYLIKKKILPCTARQKENLLVLPIIDQLKKLSSLQFIAPDGEKKLLSSGKKSGCHIPVNLPSQFKKILICEGFATGATLSEVEPAAKVMAAIDAGNLELVAIYARINYPDTEIVICADADPIGLKNARNAALKSGADMAVPEFPAGATGTDFNDLVSLAGDV